MNVNKKDKENIIKPTEKSFERRKSDRRKVDRRKNKDLWARLFIVINFFAWGVLFISMLVFNKAQPEFETFFDKFYGLHLRTTWDMRVVHYLAYTIIFGLIVSVFGLGLSRFRGRRRTDHKKPLIVLGLLYLLLYFVYIIFL